LKRGKNTKHINPDSSIQDRSQTLSIPSVSPLAPLQFGIWYLDQPEPWSASANTPFAAADLGFVM